MKTTLSRFVRCDLSDAEEEGIERHLELCADCRDRLEERERAEAETTESPDLRLIREGLISDPENADPEELETTF